MPDPRLLAARELHVERGDHPRRDLVLQFERVVERAVVPLGPCHRTGDRVGELYAHPHALALALDGRLERMPDTEAARRLGSIYAPQRVGGSSRDQEHARHLDECVLDIEAQTPGERCTIGILADAGKRQQHDRRPIGERQRERLELWRTGARTGRHIAADEREQPRLHRGKIVTRAVRKPGANCFRQADAICRGTTNDRGSMFERCVGRRLAGRAGFPEIDAEPVVHALARRQRCVGTRECAARGDSAGEGASRVIEQSEDRVGGRHAKPAAKLTDRGEEHLACAHHGAARRRHVLPHQDAECTQIGVQDDRDAGTRARRRLPWGGNRRARVRFTLRPLFPEIPDGGNAAEDGRYGKQHFQRFTPLEFVVTELQANSIRNARRPPHTVG